MQKLKFKETTAHARDTWWRCASCNKILNFMTTSPQKCEHCGVKCLNVHLLAPKYNQDNRVKYFMTGKC